MTRKRPQPRMFAIIGLCFTLPRAIISKSLHLGHSVCSANISLALSARKPATLNPGLVCQALPRFLRGQWGLPTDARLAALMRVVEASYVMGSRAESVENLEAFNMDVNEIER